MPWPTIRATRAPRSLGSSVRSRYLVHDWAFDAGLGVAHVGVGDANVTGVGVNLEGAVGVTSHLQLGLRTGVRGGSEGRALGADAYGRLYDAQTFGVGADPFANPEFSITGTIVRVRVAELALQGRAYLPFEAGSRPGFLFGMPVMFHLGDVARIDMGAYVPVIFTTPFQSGVSAPVDVWFAATSRLWLGPMTGLRFRKAGTDLRMGVGLGYQITSFLDFKTQFLFPQINQPAGGREFGFGAGIQIRIE